MGTFLISTVCLWSRDKLRHKVINPCSLSSHFLLRSDLDVGPQHSSKKKSNVTVSWSLAGMLSTDWLCESTCFWARLSRSSFPITFTSLHTPLPCHEKLGVSGSHSLWHFHQCERLYYYNYAFANYYYNFVLTCPPVFTCRVLCIPRLIKSGRPSWGVKDISWGLIKRGLIKSEDLHLLSKWALWHFKNPCTHSQTVNWIEVIWIATGTWWGLGPLAQAIGTYKLFAHLQLDWLVNNLQTDDVERFVDEVQLTWWLDVLDCRPKRTGLCCFFGRASSGAHCAILLTMSRPCRVIRFTITCFFLCVVYNVVAWVAKVNIVHIFINFYLKYLQQISPSVRAGNSAILGAS